MWIIKYFYFIDEINILKEIESEIMLDNIYLFMLLWRYCWDGVFINFEYLLKKRILKKKEDVNFK